MADQNLSVKITAQDEASPIVQSFSEKIKGSRESLLALGVASGAAFAGITSFLRDSLKAAADEQTALASLNAVIKSTGDVSGVTADMAKKLAEQIQETAPIDNDAALSAENMLLTFTSIGKDVFPRALSATTDLATAMNNGLTPNAQQLKDTAIQLGKAINDPTVGLTALQRVGVSFTQDQKDLIDTLYKSGQVAKAQTLILDELNKEFGGQAQAQLQTWSGQVAYLSNQYSDMQKVIGNNLMGVLKPLFEAIDPIIKSIMKWVNANPELTTQLILAAGAFTGLLTILTAIGFVLPAITAGFGLLFSPIGLILVAVVALIATFTVFHKQIIDFFVSLNERTGILTFFKQAWESIADVFKKSLFPALQNLWDSITPLKPFLEALAQVVGIILVGAIVLLVNWFTSMITTLTQMLTWFINVGAFISGVFVGAINGLIDKLAIVEGWWGKITAAVKTMTDSVISFLQPLKKMLDDLIDSLSSIASKIGGVVSAVGGKISGAVSSIIPHADGGSVTPGQTYLVGEQGPELFTSGVGGFITPNYAMGGGGTTINITGTFMSESAAIDVGNMVLDALKRRTRVGI